MSEWIVDTNVAIVANGRSESDKRPLKISCRLAAVEFLQKLLTNGTVLLDLGGAIQSEYRSHLRPSGQPGVGDRFYQVILNSVPERVRRVELPKDTQGEYEDLPRSLIDACFDPSDRKFAALACREKAPIANATDSDWIHAATVLASEDIVVHNLCGSKTELWFSDS